jgi:hypothetical protein
MVNSLTNSLPNAVPQESGGNNSGTSIRGGSRKSFRNDLPPNQGPLHRETSRPKRTLAKPILVAESMRSDGGWEPQTA